MRFSTQIVRDVPTLRARFIAEGKLTDDEVTMLLTLAARYWDIVGAQPGIHNYYEIMRLPGVPSLMPGTIR